MLKSYYLK